MKKSVFAMLSVACASIFSVFVSCKSTNVNIGDLSPVAIISVTSNASIPWFENTTMEGGEKSSDETGLINGLISKTLESDNPEIKSLQTRVDYAADVIRTKLEAAGVEVVSHDLVDATHEYEKARSNKFNLGDTYLKATGFEKIGSTSQKNRELMEETGANSVLYVSFVFKKKKVNYAPLKYGVKAYVKMNVSFSKEDGKGMEKKVYEAYSSDFVEYENGKWDKQAVVDLFPGTIDSVMDLFISDYVKMDAIEGAIVKEPLVPEVEESVEDNFIFEGEATVITLPVSLERKTTE